MIIMYKLLRRINLWEVASKSSLTGYTRVTALN